MGVNICIKEKMFGRKQIFNNFTYSFSNTGLYVIKGISGKGKTTLLRIISGLDKDFNGSVEGIKKGRVAMHFQEYRLFNSLNALENVYNLAYQNPVENQKLKAKNLLIKLGLTEEDVLLFPNELSGGMKMRVSLARALLKESDVLLLDEPTKELDKESKMRVLELLSEESKSKLIIMVTHENDLEYLKNAVIINL